MTSSFSPQFKWSLFKTVPVFGEGFSFLGPEYLNWGQFGWHSDSDSAIETSEVGYLLDNISTALDNALTTSFMQSATDDQIDSLASFTGLNTSKFHSLQPVYLIEDVYDDTLLIDQLYFDAYKDPYSDSVYATSDHFRPGEFGIFDFDMEENSLTYASSNYNAYGVSRISFSRSKSRQNGGGVNVGISGTPLALGGSVSRSKSIDDSDRYRMMGLTDMMDFNGDGFADILYTDISSLDFIDLTVATPIYAYLSNGTGGYSDVPVNITNNLNFLVKKQQTSDGWSLSGGYNIDLESNDETGTNQPSKDGRVIGGTGLTVGGTLSSHSTGRTLTTWADLNGDGLPDHLRKGVDDIIFRPNYGKGLSSGVESGIAVVSNLYNLGEIRGDGYGWSISSSVGAGIKGIRASAFYSHVRGTGASSNENHDHIQFIDINGDGLMDYLYGDNLNPISGYDSHCKINTGSGFESISGFGYYPGSIEMDGNYYSDFWANTYEWFIPIPIPFGYISLNFSTSENNSDGNSVNNIYRQYRDINGDGFPDLLVTEEPFVDGESYNLSADHNDIKVWFNQIGKSNMLKTVKNPVGGSFTLDYEPVGNKYGSYKKSIETPNNWDSDSLIYWDMPNSRWVMSSLLVKDGYDLKDVNGSDIDGVDSIYTTFAYDGGIHSRREKVFLHFSRIQSKTGDLSQITEFNNPGTNDPYVNRQVAYNKSIPTANLSLTDTNIYQWSRTYLKHYSLKTDTHLVDVGPLDTSSLLHMDSVSESISVYPGIDSVISVSNYLTGHDFKQKVAFEYDDFFNVIRQEDYGIDLNNPNDNIISILSYFSPSSVSGITNLPDTVTVYESSISNINIRRRNFISQLDPTSKAPRLIHEVKDTLSDSRSWKIEYDDFGNVEYLFMPRAQDNTRAFNRYWYDDVLETHLVRSRNHRNEVRRYGYNLGRGILLWEQDVNENRVYYSYDAFDRLTRVVAPNENSNGSSSPLASDYTVKFQYMPFGKKENAIEGSYDKLPRAVAFSYQPDLDSNNEQRVNGISESISGAVSTFSRVAGEWSHSSSNTENALLSVMMSDGLGRMVQVKQDIAVYDTSSSGNTEYMWVSGHKTYNQYGQIIKEYESHYEVEGTPLEFENSMIDSRYYSEVVYDEILRPTKVKAPEDDATVTSGVVSAFNEGVMQYSAALDHQGVWTLKQKSFDPIGQFSSSYSDVRGRVTMTEQGDSSSDVLQTKYFYDVINQLTSTEAPDSTVTTYKYDRLGRLDSVHQPDMGLTRYAYDDLGNVVLLYTPNLDANNDVIKYYYDVERLDSVLYPSSDAINRIRYEYVSTPTTDNLVGRVHKIYQGAGGKLVEEEFSYDPLGNVTTHMRTIDIPMEKKRKFTTNSKYDTWGRLQEMTYPDGEQIQYHYSYGGELHRFRQIDSVKNTIQDYVSQIGFNAYGLKTFVQNGNGTESYYGYYLGSRRLKDVDAFTGDITGTSIGASGQVKMLDKQFTYLANGTISRIQNNAPYVNLPYNKLGGTYDYQYTYDGYNRLTETNGAWTGHSISHDFDLEMEYSRVGEILSKKQKDVSNPNGPLVHDFKYEYNHTSKPHALTKISAYENDTTLDYTLDFEYDANGNRKEISKTPSGGSANRYQYNFWNENDMLDGQFNENGLFHYIYDAGGQRLMKGGLLTQSMAYNGNESNDDVVLPYTVYVNPFLIYEGKTRSGEWQYSKHFYGGGERVASKIGSKYKDPTSNTSGDREWDNETAFPFGQKAILVALEGMITTMDLGDPSLEAVYRVYESPYDTVIECPERFTNDLYEEERCICMWFPEDADSTMDCNTEKTYWYHSDYIGHTEFITDEAGRPYQYMAYMPFGEQYVDQHANNGFYSSAFRFNGKEYDEYTGQYYYGARYHDPLVGVWISPDPMFFARPGLTPYNFVQNNPIMLWDPTGMLDSGGGEGDPIGPKTKEQQAEEDKLNQMVGPYPYSHKLGFKTDNGYIWSATLDEAQVVAEKVYEPVVIDKNDILVAVDDNCSSCDLPDQGLGSLWGNGAYIFIYGPSDGKGGTGGSWNNSPATTYLGSMDLDEPFWHWFMVLLGKNTFNNSANKVPLEDGFKEIGDRAEEIYSINGTQKKLPSESNQQLQEPEITSARIGITLWGSNNIPQGVFDSFVRIQDTAAILERERKRAQKNGYP